MNVIFLILVAYRISLLITHDEIFGSVRDYFGTHQNNFIREHIGYLLHCPYCTGLWIALVLAIIYFPDNWILMMFVISGGQAFLQGINKK